MRDERVTTKRAKSRGPLVCGRGFRIGMSAGRKTRIRRTNSHWDSLWDALRFYVFPFLLFSALNFAHRAFVAFEIFALAAADNTRFLTCVTCRLVELPNASAAPRIRFNCVCNLPNCISSFRSSRLIAARMSMNPPVRTQFILDPTRCASLTSGGKYMV